MKKETLLKFYSSYKMFIFPGVVALSCLILIVLVILPQTLKLISNQRVGDDLLNRSQSLEVKAQTLESIDGEDLSRNVAYALGVYPADKDFGNVVGLIQQISSQTGFSIVSLSLGGGSSKVGAQSFNVVLELAGPKALLPALLSGFEDAPRLMRVGSLEVSSSASGAEGVQVSLGLDILYASAPRDFGTIDSPLPELSAKDQELLVQLARVGGLSGAGSSTGGSVSTPRGKVNPFE